MKKLLLTGVLACASAFTASAFDDTANWMGWIPGTTYASELSIPGTHDSATGEGLAAGDSNGKTQNYSIIEQLNAGVRAFDIRPGWYNSGDDWYCYHSGYRCNISLSECFSNFSSWLASHPSEFIVIHIFHGGANSDLSLSSADWDDNEKATIASFLTNSGDWASAGDWSSRMINFRRDLTVDELRGKILVFSREDYDGDTVGAKFQGGFSGWGWSSETEGYDKDWFRETNIQAKGVVETHLNTGSVFYQDLAETNNLKTEKDYKLKKLYDFTSGYRPSAGENCIWFFNFLSGYSNSSGTAIGTSSQYEYNAEITNPAFIEHMLANTSNPGPTGVVFADYIKTDGVSTYNGTELVDAIIDNNFKYITKNSSIDTTGSTRTPSTTCGSDPNWIVNPISVNLRGTQNASGVLADFNGDGDLDLFANGATNFAHLNLNGDWANTIDLAGKVPQLNDPHIIATDFDNDGDVDVVMCGNSWNTTDLGNCGASYAQYSYTYKSNNTEVTGNAYATTVVYRNNGDNTFTAISNHGLPIIAATDPGEGNYGVGQSLQPNPFAVGDFNHDGYVDIVVTGNAVNSDGSRTEHSALYLGNGDGTFSLSVDFKSKFNSSFGSVNVADFNNDGWLDIVFQGTTKDVEVASETKVNSQGDFYINNQDGTFYAESSVSDFTMYFSRGGGAMVGDFNKDGFLDYYMIGYSDAIGWANIAWFNNGGFGANGNTFTRPYNMDGNGIWIREHFKIDIYDFDYDGYLDILYDGSEDTRTFYGSEAMIFSAGGSFPARGAGVNEFKTAFGDINGDGRVDRHQTGYQWFDTTAGPARHSGWSGGGWNWEGSIYTHTTGEAPSYQAPTNVKASYINDQLTVTWDDIDDKTVGYNVVVHNETTGEVIATLPVNVSNNKLKVGDGKETAIRPGVGAKGYVINIPADKFVEFDDPYLSKGIKRVQWYKSNYRVGVQTVGVQYSENASEINWVAAGNVTGVDAIEIEEDLDAPVNVYNMQGMMLKQGVDREDALNDLPAGLYIVGNKKILKR